MTPSRLFARLAAIGLFGLVPSIVALVDTPTKPAQVISGHTDPVYGLAYTADGKKLVSGAFDKTVRVWDLSTGKESAKLEGHTDLVLSVAISPDGKKILSGSLDKSVRLWDFPGAVAVVPTPAPAPAAPAAKPAEVKKEAAKPAEPAKKDASKKEEPKKAEPAAAKPAAPTAPAAPAPPPGPAVLAGSGGQVYSVVFFPDGQRAASGAADKAVRIWDLAKKTPLKAVEKAAENTIYSVAVSPKGIVSILQVRFLIPSESGGRSGIEQVEPQSSCGVQPSLQAFLADPYEPAGRVLRLENLPEK